MSAEFDMTLRWQVQNAEAVTSNFSNMVGNLEAMDRSAVNSAEKLSGIASAVERSNPAFSTFQTNVGDSAASLAELDARVVDSAGGMEEAGGAATGLGDNLFDVGSASTDASGGLTEIGAASTEAATGLEEMSTTSEGLTSKMEGIFGTTGQLTAGFTGLATSAYGLYDSFDAIGDAEVAVEKAMIAHDAATNKLNTSMLSLDKTLAGVQNNTDLNISGLETFSAAQDEFNQLVSQGVTSGDEYEAALANVRAAHEGMTSSTTAGEQAIEQLGIQLEKADVAARKVATSEADVENATEDLTKKWYDLITQVFNFSAIGVNVISLINTMRNSGASLIPRLSQLKIDFQALHALMKLNAGILASSLIPALTAIAAPAALAALAIGAFISAVAAIAKHISVFDALGEAIGNTFGFKDELNSFRDAFVTMANLIFDAVDMILGAVDGLGLGMTQNQAGFRKWREELNLTGETLGVLGDRFQVSGDILAQSKRTVDDAIKSFFSMNDTLKITKGMYDETTHTYTAYRDGIKLVFDANQLTELGFKDITEAMIKTGEVTPVITDNWKMAAEKQLEVEQRIKAASAAVTDQSGVIQQNTTAQGDNIISLEELNALEKSGADIVSVLSQLLRGELTPALIQEAEALGNSTINMSNAEKIVKDYLDAKNKEHQQIVDSIPLYQLIAAEYGVTGEQLSKLSYEQMPAFIGTLQESTKQENEQIGSLVALISQYGYMDAALAIVAGEGENAGASLQRFYDYLVDNENATKTGTEAFDAHAQALKELREETDKNNQAADVAHQKNLILIADYFGAESIPEGLNLTAGGAQFAAEEIERQAHANENASAANIELYQSLVEATGGEFDFMEAMGMTNAEIEAQIERLKEEKKAQEDSNKTTDDTIVKLQEAVRARGLEAQASSTNAFELRKLIREREKERDINNDVDQAYTNLIEQKRDEAYATEVQRQADLKYLQSKGHVIDAENMNAESLSRLVQHYETMTNAQDVAHASLTDWWAGLLEAEKVEQEQIKILKMMAVEMGVTIPDAILQQGVPAIQAFLEAQAGLGDAAQKSLEEVRQAYAEKFEEISGEVSTAMDNVYGYLLDAANKIGSEENPFPKALDGTLNGLIKAVEFTFGTEIPRIIGESRGDADSAISQIAEVIAGLEDDLGLHPAVWEQSFGEIQSILENAELNSMQKLAAIELGLADLFENAKPKLIAGGATFTDEVGRIFGTIPSLLEKTLSESTTAFERQNITEVFRSKLEELPATVQPALAPLIATMELGGKDAAGAMITALAILKDLEIPIPESSLDALADYFGTTKDDINTKIGEIQTKMQENTGTAEDELAKNTPAHLQTYANQAALHTSQASAHFLVHTQALESLTTTRLIPALNKSSLVFAAYKNGVSQQVTLASAAFLTHITSVQTSNARLTSAVNTAAKTWQTMVNNVNTYLKNLKSAVDTNFNSMEQKAKTVSGNIKRNFETLKTATDNAKTSVDKLKTAINNLPNQKTVNITVNITEKKKTVFVPNMVGDSTSINTNIAGVDTATSINTATEPAIAGGAGATGISTGGGRAGRTLVKLLQPIYIQDESGRTIKKKMNETLLDLAEAQF